MKANELMIGDWFQTTYPNGKIEYRQVQGVIIGEATEHIIHKNGVTNAIETIPLTAEILEKNGFEHKHDKEPIKRQYWIINVGGGSIKVKVNRGAFLFNIMGLPFREGYYNPTFNAHIQYVHELQHALRLCGIEKEIVL